jgi:hypothetical protein
MGLCACFFLMSRMESREVKTIKTASMVLIGLLTIRTLVLLMPLLVLLGFVLLVFLFIALTNCDRNIKPISTMAFVMLIANALFALMFAVNLIATVFRYLGEVYWHGRLLETITIVECAGIILFFCVLGGLASSRELWRECVCETEETDAKIAVKTDKVSIGMLIVFCLITLGIYTFVWYYRTMRYVRQFSKESPNDVTGELLLVMFVPFYGVYWFYKYSKILYNEKIASGAQCDDFTTLHVVLALFLNIVAVALTQAQINDLIDIKAGDAPQAVGNRVVNSRGNNRAPVVRYASDADEILKFKQLLDDGLITQAQFEEKKNQLLGL